MGIHRHIIISSASTLLCLLMAVSCSRSEIGNQTGNSNFVTMRQLEARLNQLERNILNRLPIPVETDSDNMPAGPIKSLTFRVGTIDDRLRVYWSDGRTSDLPCTKDESVWACG